MEEIYSRHRTGNPSFLGTLSLLQDLLSSRLSPDWRKITVQGCNSSGRVSLIFTIFENQNDTHLPYHYNGYTMVVYNTKNFRQYRPIIVDDFSESIEKYETEIRLMNELFNSLKDGVLSGYIY